MSIALMAAAWKLEIPMTEKMVLLCLCDFANDEGNCWPAVETIAAKCSCTGRTVQNAIKALKERGILTTVDAPGKPHQFCINPRSIFTPEAYSPPKMTTKGVKHVHHGGERRSPKPSMNHQEPSEATLPQQARAKKPARKIDDAPPEIPEWVPVDAWCGFLEMRKSKGKPPTPRAVMLLIGKLDDFRKRGHDPTAVLDQSTINRWTDVYEIKETRNGSNANLRTGGNGSPDRRSSLARAIDEGLEHLDWIEGRA